MEDCQQSPQKQAVPIDFGMDESIENRGNLDIKKLSHQEDQQ